MSWVRWKCATLTGNGFMPSGNKPLPGPVMTKFCDAIWHLASTIGSVLYSCCFPVGLLHNEHSSKEKAGALRAYTQFEGTNPRAKTKGHVYWCSGRIWSKGMCMFGYLSVVAVTEEVHPRSAKLSLNFRDCLIDPGVNFLSKSSNWFMEELLALYFSKAYFALLVVNYGISNTVVLEIP